MHVDQIWTGLLKQCLDSQPVDGTQGKLNGELLGAHIVLDGAAEQFCLNKRRKLSPIYASAELLWYLSRTSSIEMIKAYAPQYEKFADNGHAYGAYGDRLANNLEWTTDGVADGDELEEAIKLLRATPYSKKCVVSLWRPLDLLLGGHNEDYEKRNDIPCTIAWQFLRRGEQLHMMCSMRSNDLWLGFLYDVYVNTCIQRYVAAEIGCSAGEYHHFAGSLHLYERNAKAAREVLETSTRDAFTPYYPSARECGWNGEELRVALECEEVIRLGKQFRTSTNFFSAPLYDALMCCAWAPFSKQMPPSMPRSPVLRQALDQFLRKEES